MPDLTTLPADALTVMPDGTVRALSISAVKALPNGAVIRDAAGNVGEIGEYRGTRIIRFAGGDGGILIETIDLDPMLGVEVLAGPRKAA